MWVGVVWVPFAFACFDNWETYIDCTIQYAKPLGASINWKTLEPKRDILFDLYHNHNLKFDSQKMWRPRQPKLAAKTKLTHNLLFHSNFKAPLYHPFQRFIVVLQFIALHCNKNCNCIVLWCSWMTIHNNQSCSNKNSHEMLSRCAPSFCSLSLLFAIFVKAFMIFACGEYVWVLARMWCLHYCMPSDAVVMGVLTAMWRYDQLGLLQHQKWKQIFN